jgi:uncharacterized protein YqeY
MLRTKIQENLTTALKNRDTNVLNTLRFLMSSIKNKEIDKGASLEDSDIIQIIKKQLKELNDSLEMYKKANRPELVQENQIQIDILSAYLPEEISDAELMQEIHKLIEQNKDQYEKNPKVLMGIAVGALKSKADPQRIVKALQNL